MKEYLSKYKWQIIIFSLVFIFLIPLAINAIFKQKAPCNFWVAEWGQEMLFPFTEHYSPLLQLLSESICQSNMHRKVTKMI